MNKNKPQALGKSLNKDAMCRLFANKAAVASMIILFIILILSIFEPILIPNELDTIY